MSLFPSSDDALETNLLPSVIRKEKKSFYLKLPEQLENKGMNIPQVQIAGKKESAHWTDLRFQSRRHKHALYK